MLIQGESGTGKEVIARYIHDLSARADGPFLSINCGALPESLLESELFGHVKGSFTGAVKDKSGLFSAGGEGHVLPRRDRRDDAGHAGEAAARAAAARSHSRRCARSRSPIDMRLIAATNRDLEEEIRARHVPQRSVLPPQRHRAPPAAAARARGRHPAARRALPRSASPSSAAKSRKRSQRDALDAHAASTRGPATCASSRTRSSAR